MNVKKFKEVFKGLDERFGYHLANYENGSSKKSGSSFTSHYAHTEDMWKAHLEGKKFQVKTNKGSMYADSLGLCPINKESKCNWGAIDLDNYRPDVKELFKKLNSLNAKLIPFRSKSGGIHLYLFMTVSVPALLMREKLHNIKNIFAVEKPDKIFPVQKYLNLDKGSAGSWINLPYHNAEKTERYMIKEDGSPATLDEFFEYYEKNKSTPAELKKLKSNIDEGEVGDWFKDGPPCMQALAKFGVEKSQRNETLVDMTRYIKLRYPDEWEDRVAKYNEKFFEPIGKGMGYNEVKGIISSRNKKDYPYRCDKDWLKPHCNREECIQRKFGVGGDATGESVLGPLSYIKSTPTRWFLGFNGEEVGLTSKELVNQTLAREAATDQVKNTPKKTKTWDEQIRALQQRATPMDAPEESQPKIRLKNSLETYCFNLRQTKNKKQILFGRPFHEEDGESVKVKFMFDPFFKFLKTNNWEISENDTHTMLKKANGLAREKLHIDGDIKKWVYVLDSTEFKKEEVEHEDIDFGQESEAPY